MLWSLLRWSCWWAMFIYLLSLNERKCPNTSVDNILKAIFLASETFATFWVNAFNNQCHRFCLQTSLILNVLKMKSKTDRHFGSNLTSLWHKFQLGYGTECQTVSTCKCSNYAGHVVYYYFQCLFEHSAENFRKKKRNFRAFLKLEFSLWPLFWWPHAVWHR